jgi:hypothetical protein
LRPVDQAGAKTGIPILFDSGRGHGKDAIHRSTPLKTVSSNCSIDSMAMSMLRIKQKEKVSNKMVARYQTGNQSVWKQFFTVSILSAEGCIRYGKPRCIA